MCLRLSANKKNMHLTLAMLDACFTVLWPKTAQDMRYPLALFFDSRSGDHSFIS